MSKEVVMNQQNTRFDIISFGSATVDVFVHTRSDQAELLNIHKHKDVCYALGSKILIEKLNFFTGGGGTNTAVSFSRLGLKTGYIGKVGKDENGKIILSELSKEGVEFLGDYGEISGYSVVLDSVKEDRTIFTYKGCNNDLKFKDIKNLDTKWIYMSSMMKESFVTQKKVLSIAKKRGIKIAYNPSLYTVKNKDSSLIRMLKHVDILIFNKEEAQTLAENFTDNIYNLLFEISKFGPKIVVITDGERGVHCYNKADSTVYSSSPKKTKIVETTGAGDAFASGFVAGIIHGNNMEFSIKLGMLNAESVVSHLGAKNVLLNHHAFSKAEHDHRTIFKKKL